MRGTFTVLALLLPLLGSPLPANPACEVSFVELAQAHSQSAQSLVRVATFRLVEYQRSPARTPAQREEIRRLALEALDAADTAQRRLQSASARGERIEPAERRRANDLGADARAILHELEREPVDGKLFFASAAHGGFAKPPVAGPNRKVAFLTGTFDPLHEGHLQSALVALRQLGYDEVVLVPNQATPHKPGATPADLRNQMVVARVESAPGVNAYIPTPPFAPIVTDSYQLSPMVKDVYKTDQIAHVMGDDLFEIFARKGLFDRPNGIQYVIIWRDPKKRAAYDASKKPANVTFVDSNDPDQLSSTKIRERRANDEPVPLHWLHPSVRRLLDAVGLYPPR